jgi:hypothetical protein
MIIGDNKLAADFCHPVTMECLKINIDNIWSNQLTLVKNPLNILSNIPEIVKYYWNKNSHWKVLNEEHEYHKRIENLFNKTLNRTTIIGSNIGDNNTSLNDQKYLNYLLNWTININEKSDNLSHYFLMECTATLNNMYLLINSLIKY